MHHWDRDTSGRLQRISTPVEQGCEVSVHSDQMDPLPEEQQSQKGTPVNPTAYRSMRDHIHPPRVSAPSCIIPPAEDVAVRPYLSHPDSQSDPISESEPVSGCKTLYWDSLLFFFFFRAELISVVYNNFCNNQQSFIIYK